MELALWLNDGALWEFGGAGESASALAFRTLVEDDLRASATKG